MPVCTFEATLTFVTEHRNGSMVLSGMTAKRRAGLRGALLRPGIQLCEQLTREAGTDGMFPVSSVSGRL